MKTARYLLIAVLAILSVASFAEAQTQKATVVSSGKTALKPLPKSEAEWKAVLTSAQYHVLREKGTELPNSGKYNGFFNRGTYYCVACGNPLFSSDTKYDAGEGWPSFWAPLTGALAEKKDSSMFMDRTEVSCARCGAHLGHVFDDSPKPTGLRYCINSVCLDFHAK